MSMADSSGGLGFFSGGSVRVRVAIVQPWSSLRREAVAAWAAETKYHVGVASRTEINFLTILKAGNPKIRAQQSQLLVGALFLTCGQVPCLPVVFPLNRGRERERRESSDFSSSSYKDLNLIRLESHPYDLI